MTQPSVAVVIPAHNAEPYLWETLESVRAQTRRPDKVIVVDNGSSDRTAEVAHRWHATAGRDAGIPLTLLRHSDRGPSGARNTGIHAARTDLVALLDADDLFLPPLLERMLQGFSQAPEAVLCFADSEVFSATGVSRRSIIAGSRISTVPTERQGDGVHLMRQSAFTSLLWGSYIPVGTTVFQRAAALRVGLFDVRFRAAEDREFLLRLSRVGPFAFSTEVLGRKREHGGNSTHPSRALAWQREQFLVLKNTRSRAAALRLSPDEATSVERALGDQVVAMQYTASTWGTRAYLKVCGFLARHGIASPLFQPRHLVRSFFYKVAHVLLYSELGAVLYTEICVFLA